VDEDSGWWHISKRDLVVGLQVLFQNRQLAVAAEMPDIGTFLTELQNFKVKINTIKATDTYEAREGKHDDLVLAVAIAAWRAARYLRIPPPNLKRKRGPGTRWPDKFGPADYGASADSWARGDGGRRRGRRI